MRTRGESILHYAFIHRRKDGEWGRRGLLEGQGFENIGDTTHICGAWDLCVDQCHVPRGGAGLVTSPLQIPGAAKLWVNAN